MVEPPLGFAEHSDITVRTLTTETSPNVEAPPQKGSDEVKPLITGAPAAPEAAPKQHVLWLACFSLSVVGVMFLCQYRLGLDFADEGYLWYGVQRVLLGEVPIRDFAAYDPGRYYWSAALMGLWGNSGILSLRASVAAFQFLGIFTWVLLLSRSTQKNSWAIWITAMLTMAVWMFPRHKLYDISLSLIMIGILTYLIEHPSPRRYFLVGLTAGLAAIFGRNHGAYGMLAGLAAFAYLQIRRTSPPAPVQAIACLLAGTAAGYLPLLLGLAMAPGFFDAFQYSIQYNLDFASAQSSNIGIPWPWRVPFGAQPAAASFKQVLQGLFFVGVFGTGVLGGCWAAWRRWQNRPVPAAAVAAAFGAIGYAHHAAYWADLSHLAQSIFPFLTFAFVLLAARPSRFSSLAAVVLCIASLVVMVPAHPLSKQFTNGNWIKTDVAGSLLTLPPRTANECSMFTKLVASNAQKERTFLAVPFWPGVYAMFNRKMPMWDIYPLFPRSVEFQQRELEEIKASAPGFIIIHDASVARRDDLRFSNTHPLLFQFIKENYVQMEDPKNSGPYQIYLPRQEFVE